MTDETPAVELERQPAPEERGRYAHIMRAISETPWAILPDRLAAIREIVALRAEGHKLSPEEIEARVGSGPSSRQRYKAGPVAVLPLYGVIIPRATLFSEMSGGTSVQGFRAAFRDALEDEHVSSIVFDVHSPGGSVFLVHELANEIRAARGRKPIVAVANALCASAAYHIASQADELVATETAIVGSIGVFAAHEDWSEFYASVGLKTTLIHAGKHKVEGNPFEPLSEEARAAIQREVDAFYKLFVDAVAKGRGTTAAAVRSGYGQGRALTARAAMAEGMVDRIDTLEATVARLLRGNKGGTRPSSSSASADDTAVLEEVANDLLEHGSPGAAQPSGRGREDDGARALGLALLGLAQDMRLTTTRRKNHG